MTQKTRPTMLLVTSIWQDQKSFRLIPFATDCPFSEGIYDPDSKVLVLMGNTRKETFHMMPKLDESGDPVRTKNPRSNGKAYKEQRVSLETFPEYYVSEKEEIEQVIEMLAVNPEYNYKKYLNPSPILVEEKKIITAVS